MAAKDTAAAFSSVVGTIGDIFGGTISEAGTVTSEAKGLTRESLEISDEAIEKIIADVLGGAEGLASIFSTEQTAGIFDSTVAAQAAGDLTSKIIGEIAKLRAVKTTETEQAGTQVTEKDVEDEGILSGIGDFFGF